MFIDNADYPAGKQYGDLRTSIGARVFKSTFNGPAFLDRYTRVGPDVTFGRYCSLGENSSIIRTTVGSFFHCGNGVAINPFGHPTDWLSIHDFQWRDDSFGWVDEYRDFVRPFKSRPPEMFTHVKIGNDTWIGHGAMILGQVTIGDGAIIGAGAIATKDVPPYAIVAGVPAKVIRYRFGQDIIDRLLKVKWWDRPLSELSGLRLQNVEAVLERLETADLLKGSQWTPEQRERFQARAAQPIVRNLPNPAGIAAYWPSTSRGDLAG